MKTTFYRITIVVITLLMSACATQAPQQPRQTASASEQFEMGSKAFQKWMQEDDIASLVVAQPLLKKALAQSPDNVSRQHLYYRTLYGLALYNFSKWQQPLRDQFDNLHPVVKQELAPPSLLEFYLSGKDAPFATDFALLKNAVNEQPLSSRSWSQLSGLLIDNGHYELALHSANRAATLSPKWHRAFSQSALAYQNLLWDKACSYEHPKLRRQIIKQYSKALSLKPDDADYQESLASLYAQVGLWPLAITNAEKAYKLEKNRWTVQTLANAKMHNNALDEAETYAKALVKYDRYNGNERLATIASLQQQWQQAKLYGQRAIKPDETTVYKLLLRHWLNKLDDPNYQTSYSGKIETTNDWEGTLASYVKGELPEGESLVNLATNSCHQLEARFYTAVDLLAKGENTAARKHLEKIVATGYYDYFEYSWARALLASDRF